ncbi:extracellular tyrosine-protein kinase PKDCC-like [Glandiceps talaboti]
MVSLMMYFAHRTRMTPLVLLLLLPVAMAIYLIYMLHKQYPTNEIAQEQQHRISHLQGLVEKLNNEITDTLAERDLLRQKLQFVVGNLSQQIHVISKENGDTWMNKYLADLPNENVVTENDHIWGCKQLDTIQVLSNLGQGYSKLVQEGVYGRTHVAVKSVSTAVHDVQSCLNSGSYKKTEDCYLLANYKLLKEALMLRELKHNNIIKLLGLCVRSEKHSPYIHERGITSVVELGSQDAVQLHKLRKLPWQQRLKICQSIARLLDFMSDSSLGSLQIPDFKEEQFVMVNGVIKLSDVDDVTNVEPVCDSNLQCLIDARQIGIKCHSNYHCIGMNAALNLYRAYNVFFGPLLNSDTPPELQNTVTKLLLDIENFNVDAEELVQSLERLEQQELKLHD